MADQIHFTITGDATQLVKAIGEAGGSFQQLSGETAEAKGEAGKLADETERLGDTTTQGSRSTADFNKNLAEFGIAAGAAWLATKQVVGQVSGWVTAANQQEDATARLNAALQAQGTFTPEVAQQLQALASRYQELTVFGDEALLEVQALLTTLKVMPSEMDGALAAITNFAAANRLDLNRAVRIVGVALAGQVTSLKRYGVNVDAATVKTEGATAIFRAMSATMGGQATAQARTFSGAMTQTGNIVDDVKEILGDFIGFAVRPFLALFVAIPAPIRTTTIALTLLGGVTGTATIAFAALTRMVAAGGVMLGVQLPAAAAASAGSITLLTTALRGVGLAFGLLTGPVGWILGAIGLLTTGYFAWRNATADISDVSLQMHESLLRTKDAADELKTSVAAIPNPLEDVNAGLITVGGEGLPIFIEGADQAAESAARLAEKLKENRDAAAANTAAVQQLFSVAEERIPPLVDQTGEWTEEGKRLLQVQDELTESVKKQIAETERLAKIREKIFGLDAVTGVQDYLAAIGGIPGLTKLSADETDKFVQQLDAAIDAARRNGLTDVAARFEQVRNSIPLTTTAVEGLTLAHYALVPAIRDTGASLLQNSVSAGRYREAFEAAHRVVGQFGARAATVFPQATTYIENVSQVAQGATGIFGQLGGSLQNIWKGMTGVDAEGKSKGFAGLLGNLGKGVIEGFGNIISGGLSSLISSGVGLAVKGLGKLFGGLFGKSQGRKDLEAANAEIGKLQEGLLATHGSLEAIRAKGGAAGQALADAWGSQNRAGLEHFNQLLGEFNAELARQEEIQRVLDQYSFVDDAARLTADFQTLTDAGWSFEQAVRAVGPSIADIAIKAGEAGQQIPEAFLPILQQMAELGLLTADQIAKLQELGLGFEGLAETATGAINEVTDPLERLRLALDAGGILRQMQEAFREWSSSGQINIEQVIGWTQQLHRTFGDIEPVLILQRAIQEWARTGVLDIDAVRGALGSLQGVVGQTAGAFDGLAASADRAAKAAAASARAGGGSFTTSARHPETGETFAAWLARAQPGGDPRVAFAQAFASRGGPLGGMDTALKSLFGVSDAELEELRRVSGGFQHGGVIKPFTNVLATLHGGRFGEVVAPMDQFVGVLRAVSQMGAIDHAGAGAPPRRPIQINQHIRLELDGRVMTEKVIRLTPSLLREMGLAS